MRKISIHGLVCCNGGNNTQACLSPASYPALLSHTLDTHHLPWHHHPDTSLQHSNPSDGISESFPHNLSRLCNLWIQKQPSGHSCLLRLIPSKQMGNSFGGAFNAPILLLYEEISLHRLNLYFNDHVRNRNTKKFYKTLIVCNKSGDCHKSPN